MASPLEQLAKSALIGLSRKPAQWPMLEGGVGALLAELEGDDETRLLRGAGLLALASEAGQIPDAAANRLPEAPPEPPLPPLPANVRVILENIVVNGPDELLPECLDLLALKPKAFPAALLPPLFQAAANKPVLRGALAKLSQPRAAWLQGLNPDWKKLPLPRPDAQKASIETSPSLTIQVWQEGALPDRIAWLEQTRRSDPDAAREALATVLPQEAASERAALVAALATGLSMADESMLQSLLADKSKQVREAAQSLLSSLPESGLSGRMADRIRSMMSAKKLDLSPPETFDAAWAKDGIEEKPPKGEGARACWLRQIASMAPLTVWCEKGDTAVAALKALGKSDWLTPVVQGILVAVVRQRNKDWADALMEHGGKVLPGLDLSPLFDIAGGQSTEAWLLEMANGGELDVALSYASRRRSWTEKLCDGLLTVVKKALGRKDPSLAYQISHFLPGMALCVPISRLAAAQLDWPEENDSAYYLKKPIETFRNILQMRQTIHQELS